MSTKTRNLSNISGANVTNPTATNFTTNGIEVYANDAAFAVAHAAVAGSVYFNSTEKCLREYNGTVWQYDKTIFSNQPDSTTTGTAVDITPLYDQVISFSQGSLISIRGIVPTNQKFIFVCNDQATNSITLLNNDGTATAANRILTGNGQDLIIGPGYCAGLLYNEDTSRWKVIAATRPAGSLESFSNDAGYATAHPGTIPAGATYWNTTQLAVRQYNGTVWQNDKTLFEVQTDSTTTGASQTITPDSANQIVAFTQGSLTSISAIVPSIQKTIYFVNNQSSNAITLKNEDTGATAANRIVTGTNNDFSLAVGQMVQLVYDTQGTRWRLAGAASSGSTDPTSVNYFTNAGFEDTSNGALPAGWVQYNDGATATPIDGTGGSAVAQVTFLCTTSSPIRGSKSAVITKDANNRQGVGYSFPFVIANVDKGVTAGVSFDMVTSANYVASDIVFYIYDVTNSILITPRAVSLPKLDSYGKFFSDYGLTAGTSYRFILHIATTSALAYTVTIDTMVNSTTKTAVPGTPSTNQITYVPNFAGFASYGAASNIQWRQQGVNLELYGRFQLTTPAASTLKIFFPFTSWLVDSIGGAAAGTIFIVGKWAKNASGASSFKQGVVQASVGDNFVTFGLDDYTTAQNPNNAQNGSTLFGTGEVCYFDGVISIPIAALAGAGTNIGPGAQVQYLYNSSTATGAGDTTSFAYGPAGATIQSITTTLDRRVRSQYPIQVGSEIIVECSSDRVSWVPVAGGQYTGANITPYTIQNGLEYGFGRVVAVNSTDLDIRFGQYAYPSGTYGAAGAAWSSGAGAGFWRVKICNPSSPVGFGPASPTNGPGLVNPISVQTALTVTSSAAGWSTIRAIGIAYQEQGGAWRLRFNLIGSITSKTYTSDTMTISGVTFKNIANFFQPCSGGTHGTTPGGISQCYTNPNASTIQLTTGSGTGITGLAISGDVELDSKPTWA